MTIHLGHGQYVALVDLYAEGSPVSLTALETGVGNQIVGLRVEFFDDRNNPAVETRYLTPEGILVDTEAEAC